VRAPFSSALAGVKIIARGLGAHHYDTLTLFAVYHRWPRAWRSAPGVRWLTPPSTLCLAHDILTLCKCSR